MKEIKHYMYSLLESLSILEENCVIHKDVKPDNFLFSLETLNGVLIDFGISHCDLPKNKIDKYINLHSTLTSLNSSAKSRIGTRGFLAPEIIFNSKKLSKVDVWSAGVILLCFFTKRFPFFNIFVPINKESSMENDNNCNYINNYNNINKEINEMDDTIKDLIPLLIVFGDEKIKEIAKQFDVSIYTPPLMKETYLKNGLMDLINPNEIPEDGIRLLEKLLHLDYNRRITATHALKDSFFNEIRNERSNHFKNEINLFSNNKTRNIKENKELIQENSYKKNKINKPNNEMIIDSYVTKNNILSQEYDIKMDNDNHLNDKYNDEIMKYKINSNKMNCDGNSTDKISLSKRSKRRTENKSIDI